MRTSAILTLLCLSLPAARARADGAVLQIEGEDIYVDIGARDGAGAGAVLDLMNVVVVKDPVTRQVLRDRFAIGQLTVVRSGDQVSVARAPAGLKKRVRVGDPVAMASAPRAFADPWLVKLEKRRGGPGGGSTAAGGQPVQSRKQAEQRVKDAELTRAVWQSTLGEPIDRAHRGCGRTSWPGGPISPTPPRSRARSPASRSRPPRWNEPRSRGRRPTRASSWRAGWPASTPPPPPRAPCSSPRPIGWPRASRSTSPSRCGCRTRSPRPGCTSARAATGSSAASRSGPTATPTCAPRSRPTWSRAPPSTTSSRRRRPAASRSRSSARARHPAPSR